VAVCVRARRESDVDACVALLRVVHEHDAYPLWWPTDPVGWVTGGGPFGSWVAEATGGIVGHVQLRAADGAPLSVWERGTGVAADRLGVVGHLFVDPARRREGAGRALLDVVVGEARRRGLRPVLDVVVRNRQACLMYEACGWRCLGAFSWEWASGTEPAYAYALD
jgi:GNAT superfamily N-acetyltransferase